ncbi:MAG: AAA family ATPase [Victivallales bacterium]
MDNVNRNSGIICAIFDRCLLDRLKYMEDELRKCIIGQDHAVERVVSILQRGELGLTSEKRPKGSFIFLGPTGVGKTELTLTFTKHLFGEEKLFRFDMSEFMHFDSVKELRGDEYGNVGRLGQILERHKGGTLLFDEVEKANSQILMLFLQMLDTAKITLSNNRTYDLSGFYIVFTSNIGTENILNASKVPFKTIERSVLNQLQMEFRPELVARIDEKIVFNRLDYQSQRKITELLLEREVLRLRGKGFEFEYDGKVLEPLIREGFSRSSGARNLRRTVESYAQGTIVKKLMSKIQT